jgi:transcriptional regulator with XRE-family HTH domain
MAPVDAGVIGALDFTASRGSDHQSTDDMTHAGDSIGAAIRIRREALGLDLNDLSLTTRIKPQYLASLEAMRLFELPSRPFIVGYVRACAGALGLDPDEAVERLKREAPDGPQALAAPVGVDHEPDPRVRAFVALGVVVVLAIVVWNIAERVVSHRPAHVGARIVQPSIPLSSRSPAGPVSLGAPLPPPIESTTPEPYVTPGLPTASSGPVQPAPPGLPAGSPFQPRAAVYGVSASVAHIILVASKPVSLVIHGADGSVYFARQLETGEAYAAPQLAGLTVEVSDPAEVNVYVDRALKGPLATATTSLSSLGGGAVAAP